MNKIKKILKILGIKIKRNVSTWDDRLIIRLRNQGIQVRDNIDRTAKNVIKVTNLITTKVVTSLE